MQKPKVENNWIKKITPCNHAPKNQMYRITQISDKLDSFKEISNMRAKEGKDSK